MFAEAVVTFNDSPADLNADNGALPDANSQLEQEEQDVERAISGILEVQVCKIFITSLPLPSYNLLTL